MGKKGQVFIVSVIIAVTISLLTSYIMLTSLFKETNPDQHIGTYQSAIIDAMADGNKALLYVDEASRLAVSSALEGYLYGNPNPMTDVEAGDDETRYCGSYVYRMWNSENKDCYPDYRSKDFELSGLISKSLEDYMNLPGKSDSRYFDSLISQEIDYDLEYVPNADYTRIQAVSKDRFRINILKDRKLEEENSVTEYLQQKSAYDGWLIWPLENNYDVVSCFGYRGQVGTLSGVKASSNHPGLDITAPMDTPVLAAAPGTVEKVLFPQWGKIIIDHGSGLKTSYIHMDRIADGLRVGDTVQQGQVIGYVGGRGANSANDYSPHLHFEVLSSSVNLDANYEGVPAVIKNIYVNPMCFVKKEANDGTLYPLSFSTSSQACTKICNDDGTRCANPNDAQGGAPYKFCSAYKGIVTQQEACIEGSDPKVRIKDVTIPSGTITSDQVLKMTITLENNGEGCVNVAPLVTIRGNIVKDGSPFSFQSTQKLKPVNVHMPTASEPETTSEITCSFSSDPNVYLSHLGGQQQDTQDILCVIPVGQSGESQFTIYGKEITITYVQASESYGSDIRFSVMKAATDSFSPSTSTANMPKVAVTLTRSEQAKLDSTKQNLESLDLMGYIEELSTKENIPKGIVLGLITQESGGKADADSGLAAGLMQVTQKTFTGISFDDKCSWEEYKKDARCQLRAGIAVLKQNYNGAKGKTIFYVCNQNCKGTNAQGTTGYWSTCDASGCSKTDCMGPVNRQYNEWEAALRRYNGGGDSSPPSAGSQTSGCVGQPDYDYVEKVMKYAENWGYISQTDKIAKEEMHFGILGEYYVEPRFNARLPFDARIFDLLQDFAKSTVKGCGQENIDKKTCIDEKVKTFNDNIPKDFLGNTLSTDCDETVEMQEVNKFIEQVNDCMQSPDDKCQCELSRSAAEFRLSSQEGSTKITYYSKGKPIDAFFDYNIYINNGLWQPQGSVRISSLNLYKDDGKLLADKSDGPPCSHVKNTFRLCLYTPYSYSVYDKNSKQVEEKYVKIPFALTIRDGKAPKTITGMTASVMPHSRYQVMLEWKAAEEKDISNYRIYITQNEDDFKMQQTQNFENIMDSISVGALPNEYMELYSIDLTKSSCDVSTDASSSKFCIFRYDAIDKEKNPIRLELHPRTLYYINSTGTMIYIVDGLSDAQRFIAVTGVDIDGDEIDNIEKDELIEKGKNMVDIQPEDRLEYGLTQIQASVGSGSIIVSWDRIDGYINGDAFTGAQNPSYYVHLGIGGCTDDGLKDINSLGEVFGPYNALEADIDMRSRAGAYCVVVTAKDEKGMEFGYGIAKTFTITSMPAPQIQP